MSELTTVNDSPNQTELVKSNNNCCHADDTASKCESTDEIKYETVQPMVDILEMSDAVVLSVDVPGADESTVELEIEKGVLHLSAISLANGPDWARAADRPRRRYARTFRVSDDLDGHSAEATVANGVLTIRFPKRAEAVATKISVRQAN